MSAPINTSSPLSYPTWLKYQTTLTPDISVQLYTQYLKEWYAVNKIASSSTTVSNQIKQDYIQLLKDLSFLFNKDEKDLFLSQLDYTNDEEITIAIPYFVKKLKEVSKILSYKRESVKNAKLRYNLIGSNNGLETLLYQYILNGFTTKENNITQIPISSLTQFFPALSSVNGNFFIELEELHDSQSYHDSDPSVPITDYVDISQVLNDIPFENISEEDLIGILSSRFLSRVADTPLSRLFNQYLMEVPTLSTAALSSTSYQTIYNQIAASQKYLGETVYGLTAVRLSETDTPDYVFSLPFQTGNNWFYWPSGDRVLNDSIFNNIYDPIDINSSNFVKCSATGGDDYTNSDLIFTDQAGIVEGAWLMGPRVENSQGNMRLTINAGEYREFLYPYPGFNLSFKGTSFETHSIDDSDYLVYQKLTEAQKVEILKDYYTTTLPNSASLPIYINNTTLVYDGAHAGSSSENSDIISKKQNNQQLNNVYSDALSGEIQQAFLFALSSTDIPISIGANYIYWPIDNFSPSDNIPITVLEDTCLPVALSELSVSSDMLGAVAGSDLSDSDIIYRLNSRTSEPTEAAWLGSGSIQELDIQSTLNVYDTSAVQCAEYLNGNIQAGLSTKIDSGFVSFVWMDEDTPADEVIFYRKHSVDCPYNKGGSKDYYTDQDYQNPNPIIDNLYPWKQCRCKSVHYSPIGHSGSNLTQFNSMADYLFADPQGLGSDFALNTWKDTRGFGPLTSPQFSYYRLDGVEGDVGVGFGSGKWQTGTGTPMILKTGRRYTYYRTPLRTDNVGVTPYIIITYAYKNLQARFNPCKSRDIIILIDASGSEKTFIETTIKVIKGLINKIANPEVQISIVYFDKNTTIKTYLTSDLTILNFAIDSVPTNLAADSLTDIYGAFQISESLLTQEVGTNSKKSKTRNFYGLCSDLNAIIEAEGSRSTNTNFPQENAVKTIMLFSDGYETLDIGKALPEADRLKQQGVEIIPVSVGTNSYFTDVMQQIASPNSYFNLEKYLTLSDGDVNSFIQRLASYFSCNAVYPTWYKAIRGSDGNWKETYEISDMNFYPGDYLVYVHRSVANFVGYDAITSFSLPSISFAFNSKLNGWDYSTSTYSSEWIGRSFGAKPFWAISNNIPDPNLNNKFYKGHMSYGGQVRFIDDYLPIHQPTVSPMVLENGNFLQYQRKKNTNLIWNQPLTFDVSISSYQWNKIIFYEGVSNLNDLFRIGNVSDFIAYSSHEPSTITLESYSLFTPNKYNYFARNPLTYTEDLYFQNRCSNTFVQFNTAVAIKATEPYLNLVNVHYPTVANASLVSLTVSDKQTGEYLLPEKLGVSNYRGRGYEINVNGDTLTFIDSISAERMFLNVEKYGSRNRGLTKKDQYSPVVVDYVDNRWMYKSYSTSTIAGTIVDTLNNQKYTPYQSKYEITKKNTLGLCRQNDDFAFWDPIYPSVWDSPEKYPVTFRKELLASSYENRKKELLVDKGVMTEWKIDIFGNNYGLFKTNGTVEDIPTVYSVNLGGLSASSQGCGIAGVSVDQIVYSNSSQHVFEFNPPIQLPNIREN